MLVVADSSPFVGLVKIGHVDLLPKLYGSVVIPPEVAAELSNTKRPTEVREFIASRPAWLSIRAPLIVEEIAGIDVGERAAISLARELNADVLLIDEANGRDAAIARHIRTLRTTALLLDAANAGALPDLKSAFEKLRATNFRVKPEILAGLIQQHEEFKARKTTKRTERS
jgi:predicted nucleic acid-binding protein